MMMKRRVPKIVLIFLGLLLIFSTVSSAAESDNTNEPILKEIEVTAIPLEKYLVTTNVITAEDIEKKGAKNLADVLQDVSGLYVTKSNTKNITYAQIRGSDMDYAKIFIDGVPINPVADRKVDLKMIPTDAIEKIEVVKGPAPVIYGTDSIGGVILITTKKGKNINYNKIAVNSGSFDTQNYSLSVGEGKGNFDYYFNAKREKTGGYTTHSAKDANYFDGKFSWKLDDKSSITILGGYSDTDKQVPNRIDPITGNVVLNTGGGGSISNSNYFKNTKDWEYKDWIQSHISLNYDTQLNSRSNLKLNLYRSTDQNTFNARTNNNNIKSMTWDSAIKGVELQETIKTNGYNTLTWGVVNEHSTWNEHTDGWAKYTADMNSIYLQNTTQANERLNVTLGIRYDENKATTIVNGTSSNRNTSATNPEVNLVYQMDNKNTLRASVGKTCKFPSARQLSNGVPGLKPEKAWNYELGLKHQFTPTLISSVAVFKNNIEDMIDNTGNGSKFSNIAEARMQGVELELNKKFNKRLDGFINYTYIDAKDLTKNKAIDDIPHNKFSYGLNYQGKNGLKANITGRYMGKRVNTETVNSVNISHNLSGYHVVDLKLSKEVSNDQEYFLKVDNLFDKNYQDGYYYEAPGRAVTVGAEFKY